jgi:hypothetical protein
MARSKEGFDTRAAVTRSLLGWGVVAGVFYLVTGVGQGLIREGFSFTDHALSMLMLGDFGWIQTANLGLTGLMVTAAAVGFTRAMKQARGATAAGVLLAIFGLALIGSAIFPPDPVDGFPDPGSTAAATTSGGLHLVFGAVGLIALAAATFVVAVWLGNRDEASRARSSRLFGIVIAMGFIGGAALATTTAGVILLWLAVVTGWVWLASTSLHLYRTVPHPDLHVRTAGNESHGNGDRRPHPSR